MFDESNFTEILGLELSEDLRTNTLLSALGENNSCDLNSKTSNSTILEEQSIGDTAHSVVTEQADLRIDSLSIFPTAVVGSLLNFNYKIINQGIKTSDLSSTSFFLSKDTNLDSTDTLLGTKEVAFLNPEAINDISSTLTVDSSLSIGEYYLIAQADASNSVLESDETNNFFIQPLILTQADLVIENFSELTPVQLGESLVFNYTIKNQGTAKSRSSHTGFFLSQDNIIDENDLWLGANRTGSLKPGISRVRQVALNISSEFQSGNYYLLAKADSNNNILESDETNNRLVGMITVNSVAETNSNVVYNSTSGYGTVNAAAAVARALGQTELANVVNLGGNNWGADLINAPEVWAQGYTGQGIVVAVLDTGVDRNHSDLSSNIWQNNDEIADNGVDDDRNGFVDDVYGWNFANNSNNTLDGHNHGTHVAGTIAGVNNNFGVTGIAYNAKIMPVKVFDDQGSGSYSALIQGIYYAVNNGAKVINMSLGGSSNIQELHDAINYASSNGVIVVSAAGNGGSFTPNYPAYYAIDDGLAVGAVDQSNQRAGFSSKAGNNSNMAYVNAPGVGVYSTFANNSYGSLSGTSMATPHVAGVVALMLSASNLTDSQVRQILIQTSIPLA